MKGYQAIRFIASGVSAVVSVLYFLIAFGVLSVLATTPKPGDEVIPIAAGVIFGLLAVLLIATRIRLVWALGAAFSLLTIVIYFALAPNRTPAFETWGLVIKVGEASVVAALGYLLLRRAGIGRQH